jgi:hypothetical protein
VSGAEDLVEQPGTGDAEVLGLHLHERRRRCAAVAGQVEGETPAGPPTSIALASACIATRARYAAAGPTPLPTIRGSGRCDGGGAAAGATRLPGSMPVAVRTSRARQAIGASAAAQHRCAIAIASRRTRHAPVPNGRGPPTPRDGPTTAS